MTAVAAAPVMSNRDPGNETGSGHSPSRFTAVNGKDTAASGPNAEEPGLANTPMNDEEHEAQSRRNETEETSRENHGESDRQSQRSSPSTHAHKRKRSESAEQESRIPDGPGSVSSNRPSEAPVLNEAGSAALEIESPHAAAATASSSSSGRPDTDEASQPPSNGRWPEYESQLISQAQRAQQIDASDAHLADALQREAHAPEPRALSRPIQSAPGVPPAASAPAFVTERPATTVPPKRKRVFSNRTKTGCMTCRRRKKKCDEQHPACNNCIRGGFQCEGYTTKSTWQKPSNAKAPIPLQSKEGYPDIGGRLVSEPAQHHDRQPSLTESIESRKMKPIVVDDNERSSQQYCSSPTGTSSSHASWAKRAWPGSGHPTFAPEHIAKHDYREMPPIHELSREAPPQPAGYPVVPPIRDLPHGPPHKPTMPLFQSGVEHRSLPAATMDTSSPQAQARMALSIEHQLASRVPSGDDTEKAKMIRGDPYRPFDVQLVEERDRCKAALWRFNNACSPISGLSSKEQNRLLKEILIPPTNSVSSPSNSSGQRLMGSIGQGTVVEAPFTCHYGWHITIDADVMISPNCSFVDDCGIKIGANTWIGPNVTLLSATACHNIQERRGSQSRYAGKKIVIEQDCYIGAGAIILPGITIGRGSFIGPGEVVRYDVAQYASLGSTPHYP